MHRRLHDNPGGKIASTLDAGHADSIAGAFEVWLRDQTSSQMDQAVFWAPHYCASAADWVQVGSVERLAVLISTAIRSDNNVCFASGEPRMGGRHAGLNGLLSHRSLGWAVNLYENHRLVGDVRRIDYPYDNYDSFAALTAAEISCCWITSGELSGDLDVRMQRSS